MRLWSINPRYLDQKGLVALWRESLLAKKVLDGNTKGYKNHPQLNRFKENKDPLAAINLYLSYIHEESLSRGYNFDSSKFDVTKKTIKIDVTKGQLKYEFNHLKNKLRYRNILHYNKIKYIKNPESNKIFNIVNGSIEDWEIKK